MRKSFLFILLLFFLLSCTEEILTDPEYSDGSLLTGKLPIPEILKTRIEGIYKISDGANYFGNEVALKWRGKKLAVYGSKNGTYFLLNGATKDSVFYFEGTWRHMQSLNTGLLRLKINRANGALDIWQNSVTEKSVKLTGSFGVGSSPNTEILKLTYSRPLSNSTESKNFLIISHRGGVRNSDNIGVSENSIEMIGKAEELGATGIEIDIKLTKDNVPILYHDPDINLRLVQEAPIWGPIEEFTFSEIRTFLRLVNGERIPTLMEALNFTLTKTKLRFVWLDMKSDKNAMALVIPIQQEIMKLAKSMGRDLTVVIGLPTKEKRDFFMEYPDYQNIESLNEGTVEDVHKTNSYAWGPRWTMGTQTAKVEQMHSEGRIAITWTLDQIEFISKFIKKSKFDGFVTNYPTIVAYYNYAR